jgi:hypothetical protein
MQPSAIPYGVVKMGYGNFSLAVIRVSHSTRLSQVEYPDFWTRIEAKMVFIPIWFFKNCRKA